MVAISLIIINILYLIYISINIKFLVPDERWFWNIIQETKKIISSNLFNIFTIPNKLGYGQIYWVIFSLIGNLYILRIISALSLISIILVIILFNKDILKSSNEIIYINNSMVLSTTTSWFSGKIIGPEVISLVLGSWGIYLAMKNWNYRIIGLLLIGISIGIKIYNITFLIFLFMTYILRKDTRFITKIKELFKYSLIVILTFIICNPIVILETQTYLENMVGMGKLFSIDINEVLNKLDYTWDAIYNGGFFNNVISKGLVLLFTVIMLFQRKCTYLIACIFALCFNVIICTQGFYGWYFMPSTFIISVVFGYINFFSLKKSWKLLFVIMIMLNLFKFSNINFEQLHIRLLQVNQTKNIEYIWGAIENIENSNLRDYAEYNKFYAINFERFNMNIHLDNSKLPDKSVVFLNDVFCHTLNGKKFLKMALNNEDSLHYYGKIKDIHIIIGN